MFRSLLWIKKLQRAGTCSYCLVSLRSSTLPSFNYKTVSKNEFTNILTTKLVDRSSLECQLNSYNLASSYNSLPQKGTLIFTTNLLHLCNLRSPYSLLRLAKGSNPADFFAFSFLHNLFSSQKRMFYIFHIILLSRRTSYKILLIVAIIFKHLFTKLSYHNFSRLANPK